LLAAWQTLSVTLGEIVVATPVDTFDALFGLMGETDTWADVLITFLRLIIGIAIGSAVGLGLGLIAGVNSGVKLMLEPMRWVAITIPPIVIAIIGMVWFGMGSTQVIVLIGIVVTPITYVNTREGLQSIDARILEMGRTFKVPRRMFLTDIYLPGVGSALMAGLTLTAGMGIRLVVMAELMGAHNGIGHSFKRAWTNLDIPDLFAWLLLTLLLMGILEFGILMPIRAYLTRWKAEKA